jgi:hypothetical protein
LDEIAIFETETQEFTSSKSTSCAGVLVVLSIVIVCENTLELNANNKIYRAFKFILLKQF